MDALSAEGEFKDGVFRRHKDVPGKRNVDGYQAIWEHVNKRPMVYPKPRYSRPFMMDPAHYEWVPVGGRRGVAEKLLGVFTERRRRKRAFVRLDPGAGFDGRRAAASISSSSGAGTVGGAPLPPPHHHLSRKAASTPPSPPPRRRRDAASRPARSLRARGHRRRDRGRGGIAAPHQARAPNP